MFRRVILLALLAASSIFAASCSEPGKALDLAPTQVVPSPSAIVISPDSSAINVGDTLVLRATLVDASGHLLNGSPDAWTVADTSVAKVSPSGVVTGLSQGATVVTAQLKGTQQTARIWIQTAQISAPGPAPTPAAPTPAAPTPAAPTPAAPTPPPSTPPPSTPPPSTPPPSTPPPSTPPPSTPPPS
ncbi:MAG: Ig-like domain-containing protein, partial [Gemmatimonadaceae bacterium]